MNRNDCFSSSSNRYGMPEMFPFTLILCFHVDDSKKLYIFIQTSLKSWLISNTLNFKRFKRNFLILHIFQGVPRSHHYYYFFLILVNSTINSFSPAQNPRRRILSFFYLFLLLSTYLQFLFILSPYILNLNSSFLSVVSFSSSHCSFLPRLLCQPRILPLLPLLLPVTHSLHSGNMVVYKGFTYFSLIVQIITSTYELFHNLPLSIFTSCNINYPP